MPVKASSQAVTSTRMSITPRGCLRSKLVAMFMMVSLCRRVGKSTPVSHPSRLRMTEAEVKSVVFDAEGTGTVDTPLAGR